jgi:signal transduction histidine kinase
MGKIDDQARTGIQRIYESSSTLAEIVDDYLNITRIELGTMQYRFDTISVKALVREVVEELKPNFEKKQTKLLLDIDESADYRMSADKSKLKQVFENLIDNAFKYTPKGQVKVSLFRDPKKSKIIVKITDTGIGVSEDNLPKLFEKFSRARNADQTNKKGTGLGLFVAKEIVKSHKGDIYATSSGEGKGSEFTVELDPLNKI